MPQLGEVSPIVSKLSARMMVPVQTPFQTDGASGILNAIITWLQSWSWKKQMSSAWSVNHEVTFDLDSEVGQYTWSK